MTSEILALAEAVNSFERRLQSLASNDAVPGLDRWIAEVEELMVPLQMRAAHSSDFATLETALRALQRGLVARRDIQGAAVAMQSTGDILRDMGRLLSRAALALGLISSTAAPAFAQAVTQPTYVGMTEQDLGVMNRQRPEYDAKGIPMGGFRLFPTMGVSANYDDNVFRQPSAQSDWYFEETPEVRLVSQWGRHFLELYAGADNYNYSQFSHLNLTDWTAGLDGRYDISRAANLTASGYYGEYHESLDSPNTLGFQESPNRYNKAHGDVTGTYQPNRLGIGFGGSVDRYDWKSTPLIGGGTLFNSDRNESEYQAYAKVFYDFSPGYSGFLKGLYDDRHFDHFFDRSGLHRSSDGYRLDAGLDMQITHLLSGEVYVGYLNQRYAKDVPIPLPSISGLDYGANLTWYADQRLTVHLTGARTISDVTISGVSATEDANVKLSADYEFRYNIIVQPYVGYTNSKFVGTTRSDDDPYAGISVSYLMNRYMSLDAGYRFSQRSSNTPGINFSDNTVSLGLNLHI